MRFFAVIRDWWVGRFIPYKNDAGSMIVLLGGYHERPIMARIAESAWRVWMKHWLMIATVVGLVIAVLQR